MTSTPAVRVDIMPFEDKGCTKGQKGSTKSIANGVGAIIASRIPKKKTKMERGSAQVTSTPARPFDILPFHDKGSTKGQKGSTTSISTGVRAIISSRIP